MTIHNHTLAQAETGGELSLKTACYYFLQNANLRMIFFSVLNPSMAITVTHCSQDNIRALSKTSEAREDPNTPPILPSLPPQQPQ